MKLNVYYDLQYAPVTYDFATFLVVSNAIRQKLNLESMSVEILCKHFRKWSLQEKQAPRSEQKWRVFNILSRLANLIPEVTDTKISESNLNEIKLPAFPGGYPPTKGKEFHMPYTMNYLKEFYGDNNVNLRPFKSSLGAQNLINKLFNENIITISLRTNKFQDKRNSNLDEWYKVYCKIKETKYRPIIIPDFEDVFGEKSYLKYNWEIFVPATLDIDLRMAIYEKAIDNLAINNGTSILLIFSECSYKIFKFVTPECYTTSEKYHKELLDLNWGDCFKWANLQNQKLIWESDIFEVVMNELNYL